MGYSRLSTFLTVVVAAMVMSRMAEGQPSCASKLIPCGNYLNMTNPNPPASCCNPLREAVTTELDCICNLYETPGLLASFGINVTQALRVSAACGIPGDLSSCKATAPTSSKVPPPPGVPGSNVGRLASSGMSSLLLLWVLMMLY